MGTKIEWVINPDGTKGETINPVVGCSKISAGCQNCYAENMAQRLAAMGLKQYKETVKWVRGRELLPHPTGGWNGKTFFVPSELEKPYRWKKPRTIFISSMGDLFHDSVPLEWIDMVMQMVVKNKQHTFIFLTKRPERMKQQLELWNDVRLLQCYPNLVIGVSVEDQATADERIPVLLQIPTAKRFISYEPAIGPVDFSRFLQCDHAACNDYGPGPCDPSPCPSRPIAGIIVGGESGPNARPLHPEWVRLVRHQCESAGVPFFFKQWGEWLTNPSDHGYKNLGTLSVSGKSFHKWPGDEFIDLHGNGYSAIASKVGKKLAGNLLDGRTHTELPWNIKNLASPQTKGAGQ